MDFACRRLENELQLFEEEFGFIMYVVEDDTPQKSTKTEQAKP